MNEGDKAELIDAERLRLISMGLHYGRTVILQNRLDPYEKQVRYSTLRGEDAWWIRFPEKPASSFIPGMFYVPVSCLSVIKTDGLNPGDRAVICATHAELKTVALSLYNNAEVTLVRRLTPEEERQYPQYSNGGWRIKIDHPEAMNISDYWIPKLYLQPLTTTKPSTPDLSYEQFRASQTQNQKQKEKLNMSTYKVRFLQTPSVLAQQAGEKETIVATKDDILATDEYTAVAEAAADNADAIKAVRESKGSLRVTVKTS